MSQPCFQSWCPQWSRFWKHGSSMMLFNKTKCTTNTVFYVAMVLLIFSKYSLFVTLLWNCIRTPVPQCVNDLSHKTECNCTAHIKMTLLKCEMQLQTFHFNRCKLAFEARIIVIFSTFDGISIMRTWKHSYKFTIFLLLVTVSTCISSLCVGPTYQQKNDKLRKPVLDCRVTSGLSATLPPTPSNVIVFSRWLTRSKIPHVRHTTFIVCLYHIGNLRVFNTSMVCIPQVLINSWKAYKINKSYKKINA